MSATSPLHGVSTVNFFAADHAAAKKWYTEFLAWMAEPASALIGTATTLALESVLQHDGEPVRVAEVPEARVVEELIRGS